MVLLNIINYFYEINNLTKTQTMRKFTLLFSMLLMSSFIFAQKADIVRPALHKADEAMQITPEKKAPVLKQRDSELQVIYEYNFDSVDWYDAYDFVEDQVVIENMPEGWTVVDNTGNDFFWRWTLYGPRGAWTSPGILDYDETSRIDSDSDKKREGQQYEWNRGYMLMEADFYNTNSDGEPVPDANVVTMDTYLQWGPVDLGDWPASMLTFHQLHRLCCAGATGDVGIKVLVSDNVDFLNAIKVEVQQADNNKTPSNPSLVEIPISSVASSKSTVYIRWQMNGLSHYYWSIDDVKIVVPLDNNVRATHYWIDYCNYDNRRSYIDANGFFDATSYKRYTSIPFFVPYWSTQEILGSRARVWNLGQFPSFDVTMTTEYLKESIEDGTEVLYSHSYVHSAPIAAGEWDSLKIDETNGTPYQLAHAAAAMGTYKATGFITTEPEDEYDGDNGYEHLFTVSQNTFGYADPGHSYSDMVSPGDWNGYSEGDGIGAIHYINAPASAASPHRLRGVNLLIANSSVNRTLWENNTTFQIRVDLYDATSTTTLSTPIIRSETIDIGAEWAGRWMFIPFLYNGSNEYLTPSEDAFPYFVMVRHWTGDANRRRAHFGSDKVTHGSMDSYYIMQGNTLGWVSSQTSPSIELVVDLAEHDAATPTGNVTFNVYRGGDYATDATITLVTNDVNLVKTEEEKAVEGGPVTFSNVVLGTHTYYLNAQIGGQDSTMRAYVGLYGEDVVRNIYLDRDPVNIEETPTTSFTLYPNPAIDKLMVKAEANKIIVSNILGQVVSVINNPGFSQEISLESYNAGVYMIMVVDKNGKESTQRFIKQ